MLSYLNWKMKLCLLILTQGAPSPFGSLVAFAVLQGRPDTLVFLRYAARSLCSRRP